MVEDWHPVVVVVGVKLLYDTSMFFLLSNIQLGIAPLNVL